MTDKLLSLVRRSFWVAIALQVLISGVQSQEDKNGDGRFGVFTGYVTDAQGRPVSEAEVEINGRAFGKSDARGEFQLVAQPSERYLINISHPDFADISYITRKSLKDITWCMVRTQVELIDASSRSVIVDRRRVLEDNNRRGATIALAANSLVDSGGNAVRGTIRASIATLDVERGESPGDWAVQADGREAFLISYGAVFVRFSDLSGREEYQLGQGQEADVIIPVTPIMEKYAPETPEIPLWYYDKQDGYWKQNGAARFDKSTQSYVGAANHFSTINTDIAKFDAACLRIELDPSVPLGSKLRIRYHSGGTAFGQTPSFIMNDTINAAYRLPANTNVLLELFDPSDIAYGNLVVEDPPGSPVINAVVNTGPPIPPGGNLWPPFPYTSCKPILLKLVDPEVELQINAMVSDPQRDNPIDDYITWAPTFCRARLKGPMLNDINIVLTNDSPGIPDGGDVRFAQFQPIWPANTTATATTLALTLPAAGGWVPFVIAGEFGTPSHNDKDTIIEAHQNTSGGPILGTKALMVRVRKNADEMADAERDRFLFAMRAFRNRTSNGYLLFQEIHRLAGLSTAGDEAHDQPAFYPWHRALLLHVERELQEIDPSVALPYWDWDSAAPNLFTEEFLGAAATPGPPPSIGLPTFVAGHPFDGWDTDLPFSSGELRRNRNDHTLAPIAGFFMPTDHPVNPDLVGFANFGPTTRWFQVHTDFSGAGEGRSHNPGHGWACGGGHLISPMRSACDPLFYLLHSQVDRQWAYWQQANNRFGSAAPSDYDNTGNWNDPGNAGILDPLGDFRQEGSFLLDGMWPWDGTTSNGGGPSPERRPENQADPPPPILTNVPTSRPAVPMTAFPQSSVRYRWPASATVPRVLDMIDYIGRADPTVGLGFCYEDVPY